nr:uncharacterized protein LOC125632421 [Caretta caretta]
MEEQAVFIMEDISLLRVSRESREGLFQDCGFRSGPSATRLCATMVPTPSEAEWCRKVTVNEARNKAALPKNLRQWIVQYLQESFLEVSEADRQQPVPPLRLGMWWYAHHTDTSLQSATLLPPTTRFSDSKNEIHLPGASSPVCTLPSSDSCDWLAFSGVEKSSWLLASLTSESSSASGSACPSTSSSKISFWLHPLHQHMSH